MQLLHPPKNQETGRSGKLKWSEADFDGKLRGQSSKRLNMKEFLMLYKHTKNNMIGEIGMAYITGMTKRKCD